MLKIFNFFCGIFIFSIKHPIFFLRWSFNRLFSCFLYVSPEKAEIWQKFRLQLPDVVRKNFDEIWRKDKPRFALKINKSQFKRKYKTDVIYIGTFKADAHKDIIALRKYAPQFHYTAVFVSQIPSLAKEFIFRRFDDVIFCSNQADLIKFLLSCDAKVLLFQGGDDQPSLLNCCMWPGRLVWQVRDTFLRIPRKFLTDLLYQRVKCIAERVNAIITFHKREAWENLRHKIEYKNGIFSIPPFCVTEIGPTKRKNKLSQADGEIHIIFAGGVSPAAGAKTGEILFTHGSLFNKFQIITDQKIHVHVYSPNLQHFSPEYRDYFILKYNTPYFHIEKSLSFEDLLVEFTKYDWSFLHVTWQKEFLNPGFDSPIQNGLMGPIQSGIPVIVSPTARGNAEIVTKYKRGVVVDEKDLSVLKQILHKNSYLIDFCKNVALPSDLIYNSDTFGKAVFNE